MLWRIEYFVEGKNLEKALAGAAGIALNMSTPQPVSGAMVIKSGTKKQVKGSDAPISGSNKSQMLEWLQTNQKDSRLSSEVLVKQFTDVVGGNRASLGTVLEAAMEQGIIKRIAKGQYVVTK